jgi:hypothetical protein
MVAAALARERLSFYYYYYYTTFNYIDHMVKIHDKESHRYATPHEQKDDYLNYRKDSTAGLNCPREA